MIDWTVLFAAVLITMVGDKVIIGAIETTDDIDRIFMVGAVVTVACSAVIWLISGDISFRRPVAMSAALLGPAGVFFALKGTRTPVWLKWAFYLFLYVSGAVMAALLSAWR